MSFCSMYFQPRAESPTDILEWAEIPGSLLNYTDIFIEYSHLSFSFIEGKYS
jgi:hypothetical protein